jgi:DNA-binding winged helix-turn-helix (wHTH) protein
MDRMVYRFGDFELDPGTHELRRHGCPVAVEPQVLGVLAYLVGHADRVVGKDELLEQVWGDAFVSEATLSSRIMSARKAVGDSGAEQRLIKTVHGRGFRFVGQVEVGTEGGAGPLDAGRRAIVEARRALDAAKLEAAERYLDAARHALEAAREDADGERAEWHILAAQVEVARSGWTSEEARRHYESAIELAEGVGAVGAFRSARYHLATLFELRAEFEKSEVLMRAAVRGDLEADAEARELLTCSLFHQGRFAEAKVQAERGIATSGESVCWRLSAFYGEDPLVSCHHWLALSLWFLGDDEAAMEQAGKALRLSEQPGRMQCLAHSRQQAAILHQLRGDLDVCEHWARATVTIGKRQGLGYRQAAGEVLLGWCRVMRGDSDGELANMDRAAQAIAGIGANMEACYFQALIAEAELANGASGPAGRRLDSLLAHPVVERGFFYTSEILRLRAAAFAAEGAREEAHAFLVRATESAERLGAAGLCARYRRLLADAEGGRQGLPATDGGA